MKWLKIKEVAAKLGISVGHVRFIGATDPDFPRPIKLSSRIVVYEEGSIEKWMKLQEENKGVDQLTGAMT